MWVEISEKVYNKKVLSIYGGPEGKRWGRLLPRCQQTPVSLVPEILKVLDADDVGGFPSPTKQLQGTLILVTNWKQVKTPAVIYSRASVSSEGNEGNRVWRQEGGRGRCHPGVPDLVLATMTSISCSTRFHNRDETFFFFLTCPQQ